MDELKEKRFTSKVENQEDMLENQDLYNPLKETE